MFLTCAVKVICTDGFCHTGFQPYREKAFICIQTGIYLDWERKKNMEKQWNPEIPAQLKEQVIKDKEQAFTLYLDFIVDGTASMHTLYPAVCYAASHLLEALTRYEVYPMIGLTVLRNDLEGQESESIIFGDGSTFTSDIPSFLKKLNGIRLYGGGEDGRESVHTAIRKSLKKFPAAGRNRALLIFTDCYGSNDYEEYLDAPLGQVIFFCTTALSEEDFRFCFASADGGMDEESSPMFIELEKLLKPMSSELTGNLVKPLKDLMKGVSIGA